MKLSQKYKYIYNNEEELFCRIYLHSLLIHLYTFLCVLRVRIFEIKSICVFLLFLLLFSCIGTSFAFCTLINIYVCTCVCVCVYFYIVWSIYPSKSFYFTPQPTSLSVVFSQTWLPTSTLKIFTWKPGGFFIYERFKKRHTQEKILMETLCLQHKIYATYFIMVFTWNWLYIIYGFFVDVDYKDFY